jgi:hypothetical protein
MNRLTFFFRFLEDCWFFFFFCHSGTAACVMMDIEFLCFFLACILLPHRVVVPCMKCVRGNHNKRKQRVCNPLFPPHNASSCHCVRNKSVSKTLRRCSHCCTHTEAPLGRDAHGFFFSCICVLCCYPYGLSAGVFVYVCVVLIGGSKK